MTGRERLEAILKKKPADRIAWTALIDNTSLDHFPVELRGNNGLDFYRHIGCDIFLLNGWGTPFQFSSPEFRWGPEVTDETRNDGEQVVTTWATPRGKLTYVTERGHPRKYPVDSIEAVRVFRAMWENAKFKKHDDAAALASINKIIGDDGVVTRFWGPSTIPRLLENDMGLENFYYLMADYPDEMEGLIDTMHGRELEAFRYLADGPWDSVTLVENTSTRYISPLIYEKYNMPHQRDFVEIVKQRGKTALLHMCGHVFDLLELIRETGCDGIHALTPPPTGDTPWEKALDVIGEDLIIIAALPVFFAAGPIDAIGPELDRLITPRLRRSNFILCAFADGIRVDLERFNAVRQWMERNAAR